MQEPGTKQENITQDVLGELQEALELVEESEKLTPLFSEHSKHLKKLCEKLDLEFAQIARARQVQILVLYRILKSQIKTFYFYLRYEVPLLRKEAEDVLKGNILEDIKSLKLTKAQENKIKKMLESEDKMHYVFPVEVTKNIAKVEKPKAETKKDFFRQLINADPRIRLASELVLTWRRYKALLWLLENARTALEDEIPLTSEWGFFLSNVPRFKKFYTSSSFVFEFDENLQFDFEGLYRALKKTQNPPPDLLEALEKVLNRKKEAEKLTRELETLHEERRKLKEALAFYDIFSRVKTSEKLKEYVELDLDPYDTTALSGKELSKEELEERLFLASQGIIELQDELEKLDLKEPIQNVHKLIKKKVKSGELPLVVLLDAEKLSEKEEE